MNNYFFDVINRVNFAVKHNKKYIFLRINKSLYNIISILILLKFILKYKVYNHRILLVIGGTLSMSLKFFSKPSHRIYFSRLRLSFINIREGIITTTKGLLLLSQAKLLGLGGELLCVVNDD